MSNFTKNISWLATYDFSIFNPTTLPVFILFAVVCWLVNICLLITIFMDRLHCLKRTSGWFVASISVSSIVSATSVILFAMQYVPQSRIQSSMYWAFLFVLMATPTACMVFSMTILSLERLVLTAKPMRYKAFMTQTKAKLIALFSWLLSIAVSFLLMWLHFKYPGIYQYCILLLCGLILFIIAINCLTFYKLRTSSKALASMNDTVIQRGNQVRLRLEKRFAQVVLMLLVNFVLFACPIFVITALVRFDLSCGGCVLADKIPFGKLYFVTLLLQQFHATNCALFYLVLIPKYRKSFNATWKAALSGFMAN